MPQQQPRPEPLDPAMLPYAIGGTALWGALGLGSLLFRDWLAGHGHESWPGICLAGFLIGFVGIASMIRHDANRRRRHATTATTAR